MSNTGRYRRTLLPLLLAAWPLALAAQSVESDLPEDFTAPVHDAGFYVLPDIPDHDLAEAAYTDEHDRFSVKFGIVSIVDFTDFSQDADSIAQVGRQDDGWEARSIRFMARGHFELWRTWNYTLSYEYKGFDKVSDADWSTTDVNVSTEFAGIGKLTIGKIKEPHVYEMMGDAANLPHTERWLNPFFLSRNVGLMLSNTWLGERGTWAVGWYNDWLPKGQSFPNSGTDFAGRLTFLPLWRDDGGNYLHVGASFRYYGGDDNLLRFRGKPASNKTTYFVDTGNIPGDHAFNVGIEALWALRGYSVLAEYVTTSVSATEQPDPRFEGWYVTGAWVLSGETRPYDRKVGYARRVQPQGPWGAFEAIARVGRIDLDDAQVSGGTMDGWWLGLNWWATRRWKASVGYGDIDVERAGLAGNTRTWLYRLQWIY